MAKTPLGSLCSGHCSRSLTYIYSVILRIPLWVGITTLPIWKTGNLRQSEVKLFSKVFQLINGRTRIWTQMFGFRVTTLNPTLYRVIAHTLVGKCPAITYIMNIINTSVGSYLFYGGKNYIYQVQAQWQRFSSWPSFSQVLLSPLLNKALTSAPILAEPATAKL